MKKIIIKNSLGIQTHGAEMEDPTEWIAACIAANAWGFPERPELDEQGQPTGKMLPAEFSVEIEDITAQFEQEKVNAESLAFLASTDWMVIREMDGGAPCPAEIKQQRAEARTKIVR